MTVIEFASSFGIDEKTLREIIDMYDMACYQRRRNFCQICDKKLTIEDGQIEPYDTIYTCAKHKMYSGVFQVDTVREQEGYGPTVARLEFIVDVEKGWKK